MKRIGSFVCLLGGLVLAALTGPLPAQAGGVDLVAGVGGSISVPIVSLKEARFNTVIKQQFDYSCGSAALATLLTYHYERPISEEAVFKAMFEIGDKEKIRRRGFSMLDMKKYMESRGLKADGYRLSLDKIMEVKVPTVVVITVNGYKHFVVVKGITEDEILVGDPSAGMKIYQRAEFEKAWRDDIVFVVRSDREVAKANFNHERDWAVRGKAPFGLALDREGLATYSMLLPIEALNNITVVRGFP